jgi:hypothetical protein
MKVFTRQSGVFDSDYENFKKVSGPTVGNSYSPILSLGAWGRTILVDHIAEQPDQNDAEFE